MLDLRTGRPVWTAYRVPAIPTMELVRDVKADVLVVGMGISGAMAAEALTADGHSVIMIDRRGPMEGSTAATTALVQFEIDQPLTKLSQMIGRERAEQAWRRSKLAVANIQARVEALGIDCRMSPRRSLYLAGNVLTGSALEAEADARRAAGLGSEYLTAAPLREAYGVERAGAIVSHGNLALDPRRLTSGLLGKALERGARLYAKVEATEFHDRRDGVEVATRDGPVISAGHVVLATGYELASIVPSDNHQILSTFAIATKPQPGKVWPNAAFLWEASDPYLYMRATADGRVICGGEDEEFQDEEKRDALLEAKTRTISVKLAALMPGLDPTPAYAWAGAFGSTRTGLPFIDTVPGHPRIQAVLGYGGNGITFSRIAAELVSARIAGRRDADAALFAFDR